MLCEKCLMRKIFEQVFDIVVKISLKEAVRLKKSQLIMILRKMNAHTHDVHENLKKCSWTEFFNKIFFCHQKKLIWFNIQYNYTNYYE